MFWNSLNDCILNGPVPTGRVRICAIETWQGYIGVRPDASIDSSEACGWRRCNVTSLSPAALVRSRLRYHEARGLVRSFWDDLSVSISKVQTTSRAVNGRPSCHFTPSSSLKVIAFFSAFHVHDFASSGWIVFSLFCATCWSNMTRLLNTGMNGMIVEIVNSSWIEVLGGLSR